MAPLSTGGQATTIAEVELDGWQHEGQIDGGRRFPYTFMVTGLEELIEVGREGRRALFDDFDTLVVSSRCYMDLFRSRQL